MKRHDFAADHKWENKVREIKMAITQESIEPTTDAQLEAEGYSPHMVRIKFKVETNEPKFI